MIYELRTYTLKQPAEPEIPAPTNTIPPKGSGS
jgi:hypothetical protein